MWWISHYRLSILKKKLTYIGNVSNMRLENLFRSKVVFRVYDFNSIICSHSNSIYLLGPLNWSDIPFGHISAHFQANCFWIWQIYEWQKPKKRNKLCNLVLKITQSMSGLVEVLIIFSFHTEIFTWNGQFDSFRGYKLWFCENFSHRKLQNFNKFYIQSPWQLSKWQILTLQTNLSKIDFT